jgi:methylenetetrahydrofolate dehydrogenase (NADP+) / methenyltetrahydrofolate cyclohydrolase
MLTKTGNLLAENILDGKLVAEELHQTVSKTLQHIGTISPQKPKLVVILVGDDPASQVYVNRKAQTAVKTGMLSEVLTYPVNTTQSQLLAVIEKLNADSLVHGILVQLPLPSHIQTEAIVSAISPEKDVDGLHPFNLGRLLAGEKTALCKPCTPAGIITLLQHYNIPLAGQHAVVLGRSNIVGKPVGVLLLQENATVTYCHSKTRNMAQITRQADILVSATGIPLMITTEFIKPGAVIVDVGINRVNGKLVGDVDFNAVKDSASWITPVPGGVGPMTIATLMLNTLTLFTQQTGIKAD